MKDLIGQRFKRNKYELSDWNKTINLVNYELNYEKIEDNYVATVKVKVCEELEPPYMWYYLNEIVLVSNNITTWGTVIVKAREEKRKISLKDLKNIKNDKN